MDPNFDILSAVQEAHQKLFESTGRTNHTVVLPDAAVPLLLKAGRVPVWDPKAGYYSWGKAGATIYTSRSS